MASDSRVSGSEDTKKPDDSQQPKSALVRTTNPKPKAPPAPTGPGGPPRDSAAAPARRAAESTSEKPRAPLTPSASVPAPQPGSAPQPAVPVPPGPGARAAKQFGRRRKITDRRGGRAVSGCFKPCRAGWSAWFSTRYC